MNTILDLHRSVREYIAQGLGAPPWRVRLGDEIPLTDSERPVAYVELVAPARTLDARAVAPQGAIERMAPFTVSAYPDMGDTPRASRAEADVVADVLGKLLDTGVVVAAAPASPAHIPVFDWSAIPLDGTAAQRRLPAEAVPYTWARIPLGSSVQTIKDPMDPKRFTVGVNLTVRWTAPGSPGVIGGESLGVEGGFEPPAEE